MMSVSAAIAGALAIFLSHPLMAAELAVTAQEFGRLGIELATPTVAEGMSLVRAPARVIVPPSNETVASSAQSGLIKRLHVAVGDRVEPGQVLAEVQSPQYLIVQRDFLDAHNANALASQKLGRDEQLFSEGIIAERRLEETRNDAKIAAIRLNENRQLLRIIGSTDTEISNLVRYQEFRDILPIRSSIAGTVLELMTVVGARVEPMDPVYRVSDLSILWLDIQVPQEQIGRIAPGMKVAVAESAAELPGEVSVIESAVDPTTQKTSVRATVIEPDHLLKPGQFVTVEILADVASGASPTVWAIPLSAIARRDDGSYVFVRTQSGFEVRSVQLVSADSTRAYIAHGLSAQTKVVTSGVAALKALWSSQEAADS